MKQKQEIFKITISKSFPIRVRCKKCGSLPVFYYNLYGQPILQQPAFDNKSNYYSLHNLSLYVYPQDTRLSDFSANLKFGKFSTRFYKNSGKNKSYNVTEYVTCECCLTRWALNTKEFSSKPESNNRRSYKKYPMDF